MDASDFRRLFASNVFTRAQVELLRALAQAIISESGGGGITDGDKGDITVSVGGTVWEIDPLAVGTAEIAASAVTTAKVADDNISYAKMQNISATKRVIGRDTAGAGDPEEVTLSQLLDWIGSAAQGDILYRDASGWAKLAAGTSGQVLQTGGAGANPAWATAAGGDIRESWLFG